MIRHAVELVKHECEMSYFYNAKGKLECDCPFFQHGVCLLTNDDDVIPADWGKDVRQG